MSMGVLVLLPLQLPAARLSLSSIMVGGCRTIIVGFIAHCSAVAGASQPARPFVVTVDGQPFPIVWAIIGSAITVLIISLLTDKCACAGS